MRQFVINSHKFDAAILSGSSLNVSQPTKLDHVKKSICTLIRLQDIPILGICFGMQLMCHAYGGCVKRLIEPIKCEQVIEVSKDSALLNGKETKLKVVLSHQDFVEYLPSDFKSFSSSNGCIQIMECISLLRFGVQFHPERPIWRINMYYK